MITLSYMRNLFFIFCCIIPAISAQTALAGIQPRGPEIIPPAQASQPAPPSPAPNSTKEIIVSLHDQTLAYFENDRLIQKIKISSGLRYTPTPTGTYSVLKKVPIVDYKGLTYDFKNTKWNLLFIKHAPLGYYIHGAYWHHNFGRPMSHGCINVSYADMQPLYNWADVGTKITIE